MKHLSSEISIFRTFLVKSSASEGLYFDYYPPLAKTLNHRVILSKNATGASAAGSAPDAPPVRREADLEYLLLERPTDAIRVSCRSTIRATRPAA